MLTTVSHSTTSRLEWWDKVDGTDTVYTRSRRGYKSPRLARSALHTRTWQWRLVIQSVGGNKIISISRWEARRTNSLCNCAIVQLCSGAMVQLWYPGSSERPLFRQQVGVRFSFHAFPATLFAPRSREIVAIEDLCRPVVKILWRSIRPWLTQSNDFTNSLQFRSLVTVSLIDVI